MAAEAAAPVGGGEELDDGDYATIYGIPDKPQFPFDAKTEEVVLDLRALYAIPFNTLEDGISALRVMISPKGRCVHVPGQAGKYIVSGDWRSQYGICIVHFKEVTKRPPELLLSFIDFAMLNSAAAGIFVESLQLPLRKSRAVFEDTSRITKIADIAGFTDISPSTAPWNVQLAPALAKQPILKRMGISKQSDIQKQYTQRLEKRISVCILETRANMLAAVEDIRRQDPRAAEKQLATFEATLDHTIGALKALPPSAYDTTLGGRIMLFKEDAPEATAAGFPVLTSPLRGQVTGGTAALIRTELANRVPARRDSADKPVPEPEPGRKKAPALNLSDDDDDDDDGGGGGDDDDGAGDSMEESEALGKRARRAPSRLAPPPPPKKTKTPKGKGAADETPDINKRTGEPYKRGGPYESKNKDKDEEKKAKSDKAKSDRAPKAPHIDKAKLGDSLAASKLQAADINSLKMQLSSFKEKIDESKANLDTQIAAAKLEMSLGQATALLAQYKLGLRDGAQIAAGKVWSVGTPDGVGTPQ